VTVTSLAEYSNVSMASDARVALAWVVKLERALADRNRTIAKYDRYYTGDHPLLFATGKFREAFAGLFTEFADNWTELVVDAVEERLDVEGFRLPNDKTGEKRAWEFWQANQLDADSQLVHTEALVNGMAYTLVWPGEKTPLICVEDPQEMIVQHAAGARRERLAALKVWRDSDAAMLYATLYLPGAVWKYERRLGAMASQGGVSGWTSTAFGGWTARLVADEPWPLPNPLGVVPVVPLYNKPRIRGTGVSEIKNVIPMQDATNKLLADMMVASEFAAFRQRWATGLEIPEDPDEKGPSESFQHAINRLWTSPDKDTQFGNFDVTELGNYTTAIELIVQHIASQTRTPPHYFYLSGQFPSGESIKSAETGLVAKARRKMRHFGEAHEATVRLAFLAAGDKKRAAGAHIETIWRDPESRSEAEHIDAIVKQRSLGVPLPALWERAGYSPTEIERFKAQMAEMRELGIDPTAYATQSQDARPAPTE